MNKFIKALALLFVGVVLATAQESGIPTFSLGDQHDVDTINLVTLEPTINVPLVNIQSAGPRPFSYNAIGQSHCIIQGAGQQKVIFCGGIPNGGGTSSLLNYAANYTTSSFQQCSKGDTRNEGNWVIYSADGLSQHPIPGMWVDSLDCLTASPVVGTTNDGSGLTLVLTWNPTYSTWNQTIYSRSGNYVPVTGNGTETEYDPFGNTVSETYQSYGELFTDTIGGTFLSGYSNGSPIYTWKDTTGTQQQISVVKGATQNITMGQCNPGGPSGMTAYPETFNYPDGTSLAFTLEPDGSGTTGRVGSFTLRTGGTVSYTYGTLVCSLGPGGTRLSSLTRTTSDGSTTYTSAAWGVNGLSTTVLDPGMNKTVYEFTNASYVGTANYPPMVALIVHFQNVGTVVSPSYVQISQDQFCYNGICDYGNNLIGTPITQKDSYHTIGTMASSSHATVYYDAYGDVTKQIIYGPTFGSSTAYRTTTTTYGSSCGSNSTINNRPCDIKTTNAAGNILSETQNTYTSKGFLSSTTKWTGTRWLTDTFTPNTNGTVASSLFANGLQTTYGYATNSYATGCNNLLQTSTSVTLASGDVLTSYTSWDCNMGKSMDRRDYNGNSAATLYDPLGRISWTEDYAQQFAHGISYTSNSVTVDSSIGTGTNISTATVDDLGRTVLVQQTDGSQYDTSSMSYSWVGPNFVTGSSIPCFAALNANCAIVVDTTVDPLGRATKSVRTNNETVTTTYNQQDVTTTLSPAPSGEHNKTSQVEVDALGRPTSSCEIEATGGASCGQVAGGSGVLDTYFYSSASGSTTTSVTRGSQTHTTVKDALGRVTSEYRPESGTTQYVYDAPTAACTNPAWNSAMPGTLAQTQDANGNITCLYRDSLGRLVTTFVASGGQYCKTYSYDKPIDMIGNTPPGTLSNIAGRLVEEDTNDCKWPRGNTDIYTEEWFSYDKDGRVTNIWEATPHSGGYYHITASYYPNGQLYTLTGIPGYPTYQYSLDDQGRPYSGTNTTVASVGYSASGKVTTIGYWNNDADTYTYDTNTDKMLAYTFNVNGQTDTGTLTWNADGDLGKLQIVDGVAWTTDSQTCTFSYDDVNRVTTDNCGSKWNQTFTYDQYNNLKKIGNPGGTWNVSYNANNNQYQGIGVIYDADGRLLYDSANTYTWDAYGKLSTAIIGNSNASCGVSGTCTTYDAAGRPVELNESGTITEILYSPMGSELASMSGASTVNHAYIPVSSGGYMFAPSSSSYRTQHYDWLGTVRLEVNAGYPSSGDALASSQAYSAYGEIYNEVYKGRGVDVLNFTGDKQSIFAGLFDTPNRELNQNQARWLSPDPAGASWNAYSYPTNPNTETDPSGAMLCDDGSCGSGTQHSSEDPADKGCDPSDCSSSKGGAGSPERQMWDGVTLDSLSAWGEISIGVGSPLAGFGGNGAGGTCPKCHPANTTAAANAAQFLFIQVGNAALSMGVSNILSEFLSLSGVQVTGFSDGVAQTSADFWKVVGTKATFELVDGPPARPPDLVSKPGLSNAGDPNVSMYWDAPELGGMFRQSNHWGPMGTSTWDLVGPDGPVSIPGRFTPFPNTENMPTGFVKYGEMISNP